MQAFERCDAVQNKVDQRVVVLKAGECAGELAPLSQAQYIVSAEAESPLNPKEKSLQ